MRTSAGLSAILLLIIIMLLALAGPASAQDPWKVGTWKTAQTIQPFFYQRFLPSPELKVFSFTNPADQKMALLAGSLDMCGTTLAHAIHAASRGEPVVVVAALCNKCSALVVKKDGPIQSIKDLAGKKIGYVPGTMHEILLREALTKNGINPNSGVKLVRVDFFDMGLALARGSIDAFLSGEPFPSLAVLQGYGRVLAYPYYGGGIGTINAGMLVKRETIQRSPQKVAELVRAHAAATQWLQAHPKQWLAKAATFGTPLKVLEKAAPNMELAWRMDQNFIKRVAALGGRMKALGIISREPDYNKLIDLRFVERIAAKD
ncbi:MAG: ABC transporter substrate-binding protein [Desulfarculaceae bacterium]|nr:ABC transporter substrate-binding protein [Desulfarculaceae bacterium]MCF8072883.1 ABC transporter substrate-binding protein [Desulfarculaceae bacterium]MCF8101051.1 ABC transporter substrate-binding protein [Desulfarculaceae bacterium]MCF8115562.1 ABC transporter substrate-binding protein [Desulfarculaceae bacterium]